MDKRLLTVFNVVMLILIFLALLLTWFYLRHQITWGIIVAGLMILFAGYINARELVLKYVYPVKPPVDTDTAGALRQLLWIATAVAIASMILFWAFGWFYMREQFMWAIIITFFFLIPVESLAIMILLRYYISRRESPVRRAGSR